MIAGCEHTDASGTPTAFLIYGQAQGYEASSVTRRPASFASTGGEKNRLRIRSARVVRPQDTPSPRPALRGHTDLPGAGDSPCPLYAVRHGEAGAPGVAGGQPVLHQALRLLCGTALPEYDDQRCRSGNPAELEDDQRPRCAVYARAGATGRDAGAEGGRNRRDLDPQGTYLPNRGQRLGTTAADLVWRPRPLGSEPGRVLPVAGFGQAPPHQAGGVDMGKPFRASTLKAEHAPNAAILLDKFHVLRHLGAALDTVRKTEYARLTGLTGKSRCFIKGQTYTLLSHRENLTTDGRRSLKLLLKANKRLSTAYLLKEEFGQLWDYEREGGARRFFENWRTALKWQRLKPDEKFAEMIDRHWDGIAAYCKPENKVALGFVEGMNNKIRVIQRRSYGLRDEEYLRLKVLTGMLDPI